MGTRCWIGFFHLNLQSWNKTRRFLKIYSSEFDLAPKLCSRSATGKRAFQLKKRVPECYAEFTTERSPGVRKTSGSQRFSTERRGGKNISPWRLSRSGRVSPDWCRDHEMDMDRYASVNFARMLEKNITVKIIVPFIHPCSRTLYARKIDTIIEKRG